ncbi:hypothetical protein ACFLX5_05015 [Chloroflexota bacterium]
MAMLFMVSGCGLSGITTEDLAANVQSSFYDLQSFSCKIDGVMTLQGEIAGESADITALMIVEVTTDLITKERMEDLTVRFHGELSGEDVDQKIMGIEYILADSTYIRLNRNMEDMDETNFMFFENERIYLGYTINGTNIVWDCQPVPAGYFNPNYMLLDQFGLQLSEDFTESYIELFMNSNIEFAESEKIGGVECYVVEIDPDLDMLFEVMQKQGTEGLLLEGVNLRQFIRSHIVKGWFAKDTLLPIKAYCYIEMNMTAEDLVEEGEGKITTKLETTTLWEKHNESVSIEIPTNIELPSITE